MEENAIKTDEKPILRGAKGYFLEGTAAGPGRPKGSKSIRDAIRLYLEDNPEDFENFVEHFIKKNRELAWQMLEGSPKANTQIGVDKEGLATLTEFFKTMAIPKKNEESK